MGQSPDRLNIRRYLSLSLYMPFRSSVEEDDEFRIRLRERIDTIKRKLVLKSMGTEGGTVPLEDETEVRWAASLLSALDYIDVLEECLYKEMRVGDARVKTIEGVTNILSSMDEKYGPFQDLAARYLIDTNPIEGQ